VEQLLGRVLRQPRASHRGTKALNQSYAFVVSRNFAETADALRARLVAGAGFERREVSPNLLPPRVSSRHVWIWMVTEATLRG